MLKAELLEIIAASENSRVEFKRDDVHADQLAREMSALLNFEGGLILLGVEDDGGISGLTRSQADAEEWVMNIARNNLQPSTTPAWSTGTMSDGKVVGVLELQPDSPGKPYKAKRGNAWVTYTRVGTQSREATREEEARLYQAARIIRYETRAIADLGLESLDRDRAQGYFRYVLRRDAPSAQDVDGWRRLLLNSDLLVETRDGDRLTAAGLLLFGENPNRRLPQAGVTAWAFPDTEKDYNTIDEEVIRGPLAPLVNKRRTVVDQGVVDRTVDFVKRNMGSIAWLEGSRRRRKRSYPIEAVREAVVNAIVHRDYAREATDVEVSLYSDRLEVISPGRLPNGVTVDKMKEGVVRVARNELLKEVLRDYRYVEHQGMGVRRRIIGAMRQHNGTEPDLEEHDDRFVVRLWKQLLPPHTR
ncbi:MAG: putative DNA binding domain-containing protein [Gammaproteobacteria bacterium]|nr:putative DNA binding domain-containing protein [Gammaproteobacteria bacterium]